MPSSSVADAAAPGQCGRRALSHRLIAALRYSNHLAIVTASGSLFSQYRTYKGANATMCYLQYSLDEDDYDYDREYSPAPRPLPRLRWAIPVDAVKLGASLTAYEEQLPRTNALRLCHRFGDGLLSTIPQEILDLIVRKLYLSSRQAKLSEWDSTSKCFQGRCRRSHHVKLDDDEVEGMWNAFYNNQAGCCERHRRDEDLDPADYDNEEKRKMVDDYIDNDGDLLFDSVSEAHEMARDRWLDMLCLCKDSPRPHSAPKTFKHLQTVSS